MPRFSLIAGAILTLTICRAGFPAPTDSGALVSIPKGASEQEALEELHRATGLLVLAEPTRVEHRCETPIETAQPDDAIAAITAVYQLHALVGERRVLFVRRFRDPREVPDLPIEELASIAAGLRDLIAPLSSHLGRATPLQDAFYQSLTAQEIAAAQSGQLRLADLTPQQRAAWDPLQANILFDSQANDLRYYTALYRDLGKANFTWFPLTTPQGESHTLLVDWFSGTDEQGRVIYDDEQRPAVPRPTPQPLPRQESVEILPEAGKPISQCSADAGSFPQPVKLAALAARVGEQNGVSVQVPKWAKERECFLFPAGHSGDEVLQAVAELNGWVIHDAEGPQQFVLKRPVFPPAANYADYYRKALALLPPEFHRVGKPGRSYASPHLHLLLDPAASARQDYQGPLVWQQVLKTKPGFVPVRVTELAPEWQRRVANLLFCGPLLLNLRRELSDEPLKPWFTAPERCVFRIEGEVGPGKYPSLEFGSLDMLPDGSLLWQGFGWVVNSHTLLSGGHQGQMPNAPVQ